MEKHRKNTGKTQEKTKNFHRQKQEKMHKGNPAHLQPGIELELPLGKIIWETWPQQTRKTIIQLLQNGQTPKQIEANLKPVLKKNQPGLPAWKITEQAGRFYLAAQYALKNNLHQS